MQMWGTLFRCHRLTKYVNLWVKTEQRFKHTSLESFLNIKACQRTFSLLLHILYAYYMSKMILDTLCKVSIDNFQSLFTQFCKIIINYCTILHLIITSIIISLPFFMNNLSVLLSTVNEQNVHSHVRKQTLHSYFVVCGKCTKYWITNCHQTQQEDCT